MDMREQKFGIEIEMTGLTRAAAAQPISAKRGAGVLLPRRRWDLAELQRQLQQLLLVFRDILPHRSFHMPRPPVFCSAPILPRRGRIYNRLAKNTEKPRIFVRNVV